MIILIISIFLKYNKVFEQWAAQNHIPLRQLSPVDKLSFIGKRGMGALEYAPATAGFETSSSVQIDSLYQLAKKLFQEREKAIVLSGEALNLQSLYEVGTSAGGQHPKAIATTCRQSFPRIRFKTPCAPLLGRKNRSSFKALT